MKCPKCGKEIDHLDAWYPEYIPYQVFSDSNKEADWIDHPKFEREPIPHRVPMFDCPECGMTLTQNEERAFKMLGIEVKP